MKLCFFIMLFLCQTHKNRAGAVKFRCDYWAENDAWDLNQPNVGWFKYHAIPATWKDARLRCRFEGGMLASPTTSAIKTAMIRKIRNVDMFTGIHAIFSPGSYYTIDGISLDAIEHTWAQNEPDNKNDAERCITLNSEGNFSDVNCDTPHPYICYRPDSLVSTNACGTLDPEYHFDRRTNKCYKLHTTLRTFKRAHFVCSAEGGHLAIINSEMESQVIRDLFAQYSDNKILANYGAAFIGFHNYDESADWTTLHGQTLQEAGFSQFSAGQPDNSTTGEYCGSIQRTGLLNDCWCEKHFPFICEKDPNHPAVCDKFYDLSKIYQNKTLLRQMILRSHGITSVF